MSRGQVVRENLHGREDRLPAGSRHMDSHFEVRLRQDQPQSRFRHSENRTREGKAPPADSKRGRSRKKGHKTVFRHLRDTFPGARLRSLRPVSRREGDVHTAFPRLPRPVLVLRKRVPRRGEKPLSSLRHHRGRASQLLCCLRNRQRERKRHKASLPRGVGPRGQRDGSPTWTTWCAGSRTARATATYCWAESIFRSSSRASPRAEHGWDEGRESAADFRGMDRDGDNGSPDVRPPAPRGIPGVRFQQEQGKGPGASRGRSVLGGFSGAGRGIGGRRVHHGRLPRRREGSLFRYRGAFFQSRAREDLRRHDHDGTFAFPRRYTGGPPVSARRRWTLPSPAGTSAPRRESFPSWRAGTGRSSTR